MMNLEFINEHGISIAELISDGMEIRTSQDALDIMANCSYSGASKIIIHEHQLSPDFFDLKTGVAGEILQKFSTYRMELAIVGDFSKYLGKSWNDFIYESNKMGRINFVNTIHQAKEVLLKK